MERKGRGVDLLACCQWIDDWTVLPHEREGAHADQGQATSSGSLGEKEEAPQQGTGGEPSCQGNQSHAELNSSAQLSSAQLSSAQHSGGRAEPSTRPSSRPETANDGQARRSCGCCAIGHTVGCHASQDSLNSDAGPSEQSKCAMPILPRSCTRSSDISSLLHHAPVGLARVCFSTGDSRERVNAMFARARRCDHRWWCLRSPAWRPWRHALSWSMLSRANHPEECAGVA